MGHCAKSLLTHGIKTQEAHKSHCLVIDSERAQYESKTVPLAALLRIGFIMLCSHMGHEELIVPFWELKNKELGLTQNIVV